MGDAFGSVVEELLRRLLGTGREAAYGLDMMDFPEGLRESYYAGTKTPPQPAAPQPQTIASAPQPQSMAPPTPKPPTREEIKAAAQFAGDPLAAIAVPGGAQGIRLGNLDADVLERIRQQAGGVPGGGSFSGGAGSGLGGVTIDGKPNQQYHDETMPDVMKQSYFGEAMRNVLDQQGGDQERGRAALEGMVKQGQADYYGGYNKAREYEADQRTAADLAALGVGQQASSEAAFMSHLKDMLSINSGIDESARVKIQQIAAMAATGDVGGAMEAYRQLMLGGGTAAGAATSTPGSGDLIYRDGKWVQG